LTVNDIDAGMISASSIQVRPGVIARAAKARAQHSGHLSRARAMPATPHLRSAAGPTAGNGANLC
jgi:hypothetical protein